jgi:hypothetical protein
MTDDENVNERNTNTRPPAMEQSPRDKAEELFSSVVEGKAIADIFGDCIRNQYMIAGKSIGAWEVHFKIKFPENPDVSQCRELASKCASLFHEASFYYAVSEAMVEALTSGHTKKFSDLYSAKVADLKRTGAKLPSADTIKEIINALTSDTATALNNAKMQMKFWKRILESLSEVRKNVEIATWSNSTEQKMDPYGAWNIPKTPNRGKFGGNNDDD